MIMGLLPQLRRHTRQMNEYDHVKTLLSVIKIAASVSLAVYQPLKS